MKKRPIVLLLLAVLLAAGLTSIRDAAMLYKGPVTAGAQEYYVNKVSHRAFAGNYVWDGDPDHMTIVVPDEVDGVPVTSLGGYFGRGVPTFFGVTLPEAYIINNDILPDSLLVYSEDTNIFTPIRITDFNDTQAGMKQQGQEDAVNAGILEAARANAEVLIRGFLSGAFDLNEYELIFK